MREQLGRPRDLERLIVRVGQEVATPRDLLALKASLEAVPKIRAALAPAGRPAGDNPRRRVIAARLDDCASIVELIGAALVDEPPASLADGGLIRKGSRPTSTRSAGRPSTRGAGSKVSRSSERERTGIRGLKVGYNQCLATTSRSATPIAKRCRWRTSASRRWSAPSATSPLSSRSTRRSSSTPGSEWPSSSTPFSARSAPRSRRTASELPRRPRPWQTLDVVATLAEVAVQNQYVRPILDEGQSISVTGGRHPVVEELRPDVPFTPNDVELLESTTPRSCILTGPNMAGKSTYLRQVALIVLLPRSEASCRPSRPGSGWSIGSLPAWALRTTWRPVRATFMVEMLETAQSPDPLAPVAAC